MSPQCNTYEKYGKRCDLVVLGWSDLCRGMKSLRTTCLDGVSLVSIIVAQPLKPLGIVGVSGVFLRQSSRDRSFGELVYLHSRGSDKYTITSESGTSSCKGLKSYQQNRKIIILNMPNTLANVLTWAWGAGCFYTWWEKHYSFLLISQQTAVLLLLIDHISGLQCQHNPKRDVHQ